MNRNEPIAQLPWNRYSERKRADTPGCEKYTRVPSNMRRMERSSAVRFFIQPMNYKPSHDIILIPQSRVKNRGLLLDAVFLKRNERRCFAVAANEHE
jgi:hypothetical protein